MKKALLCLFMAFAVMFTANAQIKNIKSDRSSSSTSTSSSSSSVSSIKPSKSYFAFLVGWDGLGNSMFSGLGTSEGDAFSTKPWFNSWQLEIGYNYFQNNGFKAFVGLGYESDVYLMSNDFIYFDRNDPAGTTMKIADDTYLTANNLATTGWKSRICARYVTIPIGIDYKVSDEFGFGLTLVPGLNFNTKHTGLKYKLDGDNQSALRDDISKYINSFKFDIRANISFSLINLFVQVSPVPLFRDITGDDIYPFRLGFMLKM